MTPRAVCVTLCAALLTSLARAQTTHDACDYAAAARCETAVQDGMLAFTSELQHQLDEMQTAYLEQIQSLTALSTEKGCTPPSKTCATRIATYACTESHWRLYNCTDAVPLTREDTYTEVTSPGSVSGGYCAVHEPTEVCGSAYEVSVELYNLFGNDFHWGADAGQPGIMYNVQDDTNFDFVYFRPHDETICYQVGHVAAGRTETGGVGACSNPVRPRTWFKLRVVVTADEAQIYIDGRLVISTVPHLSLKGRSGVLVWKGLENTIHFKNFRMAKR